MKSFKLLFIFFILLSGFSCNRNKSAQIPSNKVLVEDSTQITIQEYNKMLVLQEDSILNQYVKKQPQAFQKHEIGIWYHFIKKNKNGTPLVTQKSTQVDYYIFSLNKELLDFQTEVKIIFGKKLVPVGLEEGIKLMNSNEKARFIIPWYLAYGTSGTQKIQPYTSLIVEVKTY